VPSVRKPWWQQATALVTVTTGGVITGFNFVPGAAATMTTPTSVPLHLLALEQAGQPGAAMNARAIGGDSADSGTSDALLRSAIVNVAKYYLQIATTRTPAQMESLIWDNTSLNGADHGPSCAAFASLTLELAAQAVGQQSWVSGGSSYPFPLPAWADVRVDTNPASPAVTSVMADAKTHDRWHPIGDGYQPKPGDWVLFGHHVEVVTRSSGGVLDTIGADSDPGLTVNAHSYGGTLADDGVVGFVDNGHLAAASSDPVKAAPTTGPSTGTDSGTPAASTTPKHSPAATPSGSHPATSPTASASDGQAVVPGIGQELQVAPSHDATASSSPTPSHGAVSAKAPTTSPATPSDGQAAVPGMAQPSPAAPGHGATASRSSAPSHSVAQAASAAPGHGATAAGAAAVPGVAEPASASITANAGARSGAQTDDAGEQTAAIPGTLAVGTSTAEAGPKASTSAGVAAVPGASPAAVAPAAVAPAVTAAAPGDGATHHASSGATPAAAPAASAPASDKSGQYRQYAAPAQATPGTRTQQAFISLIAPGAVAAQQRWGVPAAVTIAQAIEESSWGNSQLSAEYHNLFGIKGSGPAGSVAFPTSEFYGGQWVTIDAQFRVYHNVAESIADHAELLATSGYYQRAMADRAIPDAFANDLTGVYATDPDYGANLIAIMKLYNLYRFDSPSQSAGSVQPQSAPATATATPAPTASPSTAASAPSSGQPTAGHSTSAQPTTSHPTTGQPTAGHSSAGTAAIPGLGSPDLAPSAGAVSAGTASAAPHQAAASIPGVVAPSTGGTASTPPATTTPQATSTPVARTTAAPQATTTAPHAASTAPAANQAHGGAVIPGLATPAGANYQRQPAAAGTTAATTAARYQPQFTTAVTTAYFASAKGPLGHGEHLYRDVAAQSGIRWELLAACDWMQCKGNPRLSPVHGEKIGALNSDGTSYSTKSAALGQCARDLIALASAVYGIDLTARRLLSVRALADAFAAFRWGALLARHSVSAMEFPYSVAGLTAQHQKMHWPAINDPAAPDRPGARFREPFGAVPVVLSLDYPATVLTDRKRRRPRVPVPFLAPPPVQPRRSGRARRPAGDRAAGGRAVRPRPGRRAVAGRRRRRRPVPSDDRAGR